MRTSLMMSLILIASMVVSSSFAADIVETAKAKGDFTKLLAANVAAGTTSILEGLGPFTVLAPNDIAFAKVPAEELGRFIQPAALTILKMMLADHVVISPP